jgi:hypothetical protein
MLSSSVVTRPTALPTKRPLPATKQSDGFATPLLLPMAAPPAEGFGYQTQPTAVQAQHKTGRYTPPFKGAETIIERGVKTLEQEGAPYNTLLDEALPKYQKSVLPWFQQLVNHLHTAFDTTKSKDSLRRQTQTGIRDKYPDDKRFSKARRRFQRGLEHVVSMPGAAGLPEVAVAAKALQKYLTDPFFSAEDALQQATATGRLTSRSDRGVASLHHTLNSLSAEKTVTALEALEQAQDQFNRSLEKLQADSRWDREATKMEFELLAATHDGFEALQKVIGSNSAIKQALTYIEPILAKRNTHEQHQSNKLTHSASPVAAVGNQLRQNHPKPEPTILPSQANRLSILIEAAHEAVEAQKETWLQQLPRELQTAARHIASQVGSLQKSNPAYNKVDIPTIDATALAKVKLTPAMVRENLELMKETVMADVQAVQQNPARILSEQGSLPAKVYKTVHPTPQGPVTEEKVLETFANYTIPYTPNLNPVQKALLGLADWLYPPPGLKQHDEHSIVSFAKISLYSLSTWLNRDKAFSKYVDPRAPSPEWVRKIITPLRKQESAYTLSQNMGYAQALLKKEPTIIQLLKQEVERQTIKIANT